MSWIDERRQLLRIVIDQRVREQLELETRGNDPKDRGPCQVRTEAGYLCTHRETVPGSGKCGTHVYLEREYGSRRQLPLMMEEAAA